MKQHVAIEQAAGEVLTALKKGVLLTTQAGGKVNPMTIAWGALGYDWGKPVFTIYVRESRFSRGLLEKNPEFTISVPDADTDREILAYCGKVSGRDADKVQALGLHTEPPESISVPGLRELPLTLECRVIYRQVQNPAAIPEDAIERYYPADAAGRRDYHTAYCGEIVAAYRILP